MLSMKCHQCGKVKRCQMYVRYVEGETRADVSYLCRPCARELGYLI